MPHLCIKEQCLACVPGIIGCHKPWPFHRGAKRRSLIPEFLSRQIGASIALQLLSLQYSNKVEYTKREYQVVSFLEYYRNSHRVKWLYVSSPYIRRAAEALV